MTFLEQVDYIAYVIEKRSKSIKANMQTFSTHSFLQKILKNKKGPGTSFQATFYLEFFDKNLSFIIRHKLPNFHYQSKSTSYLPYFL